MLFWGCVGWGRVLPPDIVFAFIGSSRLRVSLLSVDVPRVSRDCGVRDGEETKAVKLCGFCHSLLMLNYWTWTCISPWTEHFREEVRSSATQGIAVGWLIGKAVGKKQYRLVHVLSHLQRFSCRLISPIIKLSLWVFQVDASQGLECSLTGRNQKQHVLVMLCQLWITRNVWGFVLKMQMPSIVSSQCLLPWANLRICHGQNVCCAVYFTHTEICLICLYRNSKSGVSFFLEWNLHCPCNLKFRGWYWTCSVATRMICA